MSTYILKTDYKSNIRKNRLDQLTEYDDSMLDKAESRAIGMMKSYLNSRYDVEAIFSATDEDRDPTVLGFTIDLALYYLWRLANPRKVPDYVKEAKDDAMDWLMGVQSGEVVPAGLPMPEDGGKSFITYGGNTKRNNNPE